MFTYMCLRSKLNTLNQCFVNCSKVHSITRQTLNSNVLRPFDLNTVPNPLWPVSRAIHHSSQALTFQGCLSISSLSQQWPNKALGLLQPPIHQFNNVRFIMKPRLVDSPDPEKIKKNLWFKVHYPEDGKYTISPLRMTKLAGRDPETGRIIYGKIGGGHKRKFRWVIYDRVPTGSKDPLIEKVMHTQYDPNRTARIALVGHDDKLRYIIATENMKKGDLITSTRHLPKMPIRPKNGDCHPIGALPVGTRICCIEIVPGVTHHLRVVAGSSALIVGKVGPKMVVQMSPYREIALDPTCLVNVGQVSFPTGRPRRPIGSAQRMRWLGITPGSGLFKKKTGRFGFKRKTKGAIVHMEQPPEPLEVMRMNVLTEQSRKPTVAKTKRIKL